MGVVFRARDPRLGREVAVKVLREGLTGDGERLRRFEREARAAGALNHPSVLAVYDVGTDDGVPYVVSELLEGETLRERLSSGPLPPRKAVELAAQIAAGLAAAHERGIVHRDLKPENLFLTRDGRVKILDFGLAKLGRTEPTAAEAETLARETRPGAVMGTVGYMSPEQLRGQEADARSDIFALGLVLFEMLSGRAPFAAPTAADTLSAILHADPPELPAGGAVLPGLDRIVRRCLEKSPGERFQSSRDLGFALEAVQGGATALPAGAATAPARRSLAVLPFKDLARDAANAHLGIGLADATITELALVGSLLVRPTAAILRYRDQPVDPQEAARQLAVDAVVDGSFQRAGERLRVTVQLVAADGGPLWASKIDTTLDDLFRMQDEVSRRIAGALQVALTSGDERRLAATPRAAPAGGAYELYVKGKLSLFRGTLADVNEAIDCFERARDADPGFALAWAGLADAYVRMAFEHAPEGEFYERAQAMCDRALEIEPDLPEGRYLRGRLAWTPHAGFDHATALREATTALARHPGLNEARYLVGLVLFHVGLIEEAVREFEWVLERHPDDPYAHMHIPSCRLHQGRFVESLDLAETAARRAPTFWMSHVIALCQLRLGRLEEAARTLDRLSRQSPDYSEVHALGALIAALRGDLPRAREGIERTQRNRREFGHYHHAQYDMACTHAALGQPDEAVEQLRAAAGNGYPCHPFFAVDPLLDPLRGHGSFVRWMDELSAECEGYRKLWTGLVAGRGDL